MGGSGRPSERRTAGSKIPASDCRTAIVGQLGETGLDVSLVPLDLPLDEAFHIGAVVRGEPAPLDEQVGQGMLFLTGPEGAGVNELRARDRVGLQRKHAEEEVAVGVGVRHRIDLPRKWR